MAICLGSSSFRRSWPRAGVFGSVLPLGAGFLVDAHDKRPRVFKTLDAAVRELQRIGFAVPGLEVCRGS